MLENSFIYFLSFFDKELVKGLLSSAVYAVIFAVPAMLWRLITAEHKRRIFDFFVSADLFSPDMNKYTIPQFTAERFFDKENSAPIKYNDLWKYIIDRNNDRKSLVIYAEAGMGKTCLLRYITYRLLLRSSKDKHYADMSRRLPIVTNYIYYSEFRNYESIDMLVNEIREKQSKGRIDYIIIDGFDECREFFIGASAKDVLNHLITALADTKISTGVRKIILSSRTDMFEHGKSALSTIYTEVDRGGIPTDISVDMVKIDYFSVKQIIKRYRVIHKLNKSIIKKNVAKKLSEYIEQENREKEKCILRIPFFIQYADDLFDKVSGTFINSHVDALNKIVQSRIDEEYIRYRQIDKNLDVDLYTAEMKSVLGQIAFAMYKNKSQFLFSDVYNTIQCKYQTQKDRLLIVRETGESESFDRFSFQHKLFYEYFLVYYIVSNENITSLSERRELLGFYNDPNEQSMSLNPTFAKKLYNYFLHKERWDIITKNISCFTIKDNRSLVSKINS